jgi:hypothetical protein
MEFYDNNNNFYCDYQQNSATNLQQQEVSFYIKKIIITIKK